MNKKIPSLLSVAALLALTAGCSHSQLNNPSAGQANNQASNYGENQPLAVTDGQSQSTDASSGNAGSSTTASNDRSTDTLSTSNSAPERPVTRNGTDGTPTRSSTGATDSQHDASLGASSSGRGR